MSGDVQEVGSQARHFDNFIGLDVHDVGHWHEPIAPGHVFTVDNGIYIREENLGIRLENDIVITLKTASTISTPSD